MATFWMILRVVVMVLPYITTALGALMSVAGAKNSALLSSKPEYANYDTSTAAKYGPTQEHAGYALIALGLAGIPATKKYHDTHPLTPATPIVPIGRPNKPPAPNPNDPASTTVANTCTQIESDRGKQRDAWVKAWDDETAAQVGHLQAFLDARKAGA
jgi:hypothetical protein